MTIKDNAQGIVVPGTVVTPKITSTGDNDVLTIASNGVGTFNVKPTADVGIDVDDMLIDANAIVTSGAALTLTGGAASTWSTGAGKLTLQGAEGVTVTSTGGEMHLNGTGQTVDLDAEVFELEGGATSVINVTGGDLELKTTTTGAITVASVGLVDVDADGGLLTLDGSTGINIGSEANVAVNFNASTLDIAAATDVDIKSGNGSGAVKIDALSLSLNQPNSTTPATTTKLKFYEAVDNAA
ncbi:uncharacterized protein METZ01_LOCUS484935, partial [marine metagenome]